MISNSVRNYVTKSISKCWASDSRNFDLSIEGLKELCDSVEFIHVDDESFVQLYSLYDEESKVLYACNGRDELKARKACKAFAEAGYVLALFGTVPKGCEAQFEMTFSILTTKRS